MKPLNKHSKEVLRYLVFGVLTTLVNILTYAGLTKLMALGYKTATTLAWVVAVLFAYVTNKRYVFNSSATRPLAVLKEVGAFFFFRAASYGLDIATMVVFIDILHFRNDLAVKVLANVLVIMANYLASKFIIFTKRD